MFACVFAAKKSDDAYLFATHNRTRITRKNTKKVGQNDDPAMRGEYSSLLARSRFCLVLSGDGWSARWARSCSMSPPSTA